MKTISHPAPDMATDCCYPISPLWRFMWPPLVFCAGGQPPTTPKKYTQKKRNSATSNTVWIKFRQCRCVVVVMGMGTMMNATVQTVPGVQAISSTTIKHTAFTTSPD